MVLLSVEVLHGIWRDVIRLPKGGLERVEGLDGEFHYRILPDAEVAWIDQTALSELPRCAASWRIIRNHDDGSTSVTIERLRLDPEASSGRLHLARSSQE